MTDAGPWRANIVADAGLVSVELSVDFATKLLMSWEDIGANHPDVPASNCLGCLSSCDSNFPVKC